MIKPGNDLTPNISLRTVSGAHLCLTTGLSDGKSVSGVLKLPTKSPVQQAAQTIPPHSRFQGKVVNEVAKDSGIHTLTQIYLNSHDHQQNFASCLWQMQGIEAHSKPHNSSQCFIHNWKQDQVCCKDIYDRQSISRSSNEICQASSASEVIGEKKDLNQVMKNSGMILVYM